MNFREHYKMSPQEWVDKQLEDMDRIMENPDDENESDRNALAIDTIIIKRICVAFGGPSMFYEVDYQEGDIVGGRFLYGWWGDNETVELTEQEAQKVAEFYYVSEEF